jgi:hypothetical protein
MTEKSTTLIDEPLNQLKVTHIRKRYVLDIGHSRSFFGEEDAVKICLAVLFHAYEIPEIDDSFVRRQLKLDERFNCLVKRLNQERHLLAERVEEQAALLQKYRALASLTRIRHALDDNSKKEGTTEAEVVANQEAARVAAELFAPELPKTHPMTRRDNVDETLDQIASYNLPRGGRLVEGREIPVHRVSDLDKDND